MKRRRSSLLALLSLASALLPVTAAHAQLYGNSFGSSGAVAIYDVNTATGAATNPRPTGLTSAVVGIAFQPTTGTMYGLTASAGTQQNSLVQINHLTGAGTVVGATGLSTIFEGDLAFNPTNGSLYGIGSISGSNVQLFQINVATGAATVIGNTPTVADYSALAFNSAGVLFT